MDQTGNFKYNFYSSLLMSYYVFVVCDPYYSMDFADSNPPSDSDPMTPEDSDIDEGLLQ